MEYVVILTLVAMVGLVSWQRWGSAVRDDIDENQSSFGYLPEETP